MGHPEIIGALVAALLFAGAVAGTLLLCLGVTWLLSLGFTSFTHWGNIALGAWLLLWLAVGIRAARKK